MTTWRDDLQLLRHPHGATSIAGSEITWSLAPGGVWIDPVGVARTPGRPVSASRIWVWFGDAIRAAARTHDVPVELLVATCLTEAGGGAKSSIEVSRAKRLEPGYVSWRETPNKISMGCCQTLLSTARAALHNPLLGLENLAEPDTSFGAAAAYIASQYAHTRFDPPLVAAAYNAGSLRPSSANRWGLVSTADHIDRFCAWFGDVMSLGCAHEALTQGAPSFAAMFHF